LDAGDLISVYKKLQSSFPKDQQSDAITQHIKDISLRSLSYLRDKARKDLISKIQGKEYFSFSHRDRISRPVNSALFRDDPKQVEKFLRALSMNSYEEIPSEDITKACYSIAMGFCCVVDLNKAGDQKTPATFFEYFIGHMFAKRFGINPRKQLDVLNIDMKATLPTDFIFDLGLNKAKFHLPVKTSTRERVIQVWAHQRVLDGVYGTGRFLGILTCLTETKLDHRSLEVIEICLPDQWRIYQMFIAQLKRIYYLDVPRPYEALNKVFPKIEVKPLGEFFYEADELVS